MISNEDQLRFIEEACQRVVGELGDFHPNACYEMRGYVGEVRYGPDEVRSAYLSYDPERNLLEVEYRPSEPGSVASMTFDCSYNTFPDMQPVADWL